MSIRALLIAVALGSTSLASAQTTTLVDEPAGTEALLYEQYRPIGGRLGSFFLYPEVSVAPAVTDNVRANDVLKEGDIYVDLLASARLVREDGASRYVARAYAGQRFHADITSEDYTRFGGSVSARIGALDTTHWEVRAFVEHDVVDRQALGNLSGTAEPVPYTDFGGEIFHYRRLNRLILGVGGKVERFAFEDVAARAGGVFDQTFRNYTTYEVRGEAGYQVNEALAAIVRGSYAKLDYDLGPEDGGFVAGIDRDRDSDRYRVETGVRLTLDDRLVGDATVGYSERRYARQIVPLQKSDGLSFAANLRWTATDNLVARLKLDSQFVEAGSVQTAGFRVEGGSLSFEYGPGKDWLIIPYASYRHVRAIGVGADADEYGAKLSLVRFWGRRFVSNLEAGYNNRTSIDSNLDYSRLYATLGITARF